MRRQRADSRTFAPAPGIAEAGHDSLSPRSLLDWGCCQPIVGGGCERVRACVCVVVVDSDWCEAVRCKDLEPSPLSISKIVNDATESGAW